MRARAVLALVAAAVVGTVGGVSTALVAPWDGGGPDPDGAPAAFRDPLSVGIPQQDLDCTGESVLVVAHTDTRAGLQAAVSDNPDEEVRYLRIDDSCPTHWIPDGATARREYAAYLGPAPATELCAQRMSTEHKGDHVTRLNAGNTTFVACVCELDYRVAPVLDPDVPPTTGTSIWVRALQDMLHVIDAARPPVPSTFPEAGITGELTEATVARVVSMQEHHEIVPANGVVGPDTWRTLKDVACGLYDY